MSLVKPLLSPIASFDATENHKFSFIVNGGDQVVKNTIQIVNNQTSAIVYEHTENTFSYEQTVNANVLENGVYYAVRFKTFNRNDESSAWSDLEPFHCYSSPTISFNVTDGQEVNESNLQVELSYNQAQHELLNYAVIDLYDENHRLIETSSYLYNASTEFPIVCRYTFHGLINMNTYYIKGRVNTLGDMNKESNFVSFHIRYINPILHSGFNAEVENCHNYVALSTNVKVVSGVYHPLNETPTYIDNQAIDLRSMVANIGDGMYSKYAEFSSGYVIPKNFLFRMWFKVGDINKNIAIFQSQDTTETITLKWVRDTQLDYVELKTTSGTRITSNGVVHSNGLNEYFLWLKVVGHTWTLQLEAITTTSTIINWNDNTTNIQNLATLDKTYVSENFETYSMPPQREYALENTLTDLIIGNGVFSHMNVSTNIDLPYTHDIPQNFDEYTIMNCSFDGNLNGGSADSDITNLKALKIKRREKNTSTNWVTIYEHSVADFSDLELTYHDYFVPCGKEIEYALVPVLNGNIDGDYYVKTVKPQWSKVVLSDKENHFEFLSEVKYNSFNQNIEVGILQPIGSKYPTLLQNSTTNYLSGQITLKLLGYEYDGVSPDRINVHDQLQDVLAFLTNGKAKVLTDWNGNAIILRVSETPTIDCISEYGMGIYNVSFAFVEQGKVNNENDLKDLNLKG